MAVLVQRLSANATGHDYVIGDLHGRFTEFTRALRSVNFDPHCDRVLSVGDLIDRGPDSMACLKLLRSHWFFAVRGNHEQMMIDALSGNGDAIEPWTRNGGSWALLESR